MSSFNLEKLPYRKGVTGILIDSVNNFLIAQSVHYAKNDWGFISGGLEINESHEKALLRELNEELGSDDFSILNESKHINKFDWPASFIEEDLVKGKVLHRGQERKQFLVRFNGSKNDLKFNIKELRQIKWVKAHELESHFNFKDQWKLAEKVLKEFGLI